MKNLRRLIIFSLMAALLGLPAWATNGDNLIGIGPISRAMGGVGIAAPQDAISAVFSNPASMCYGAFCPESDFDFSGTLFRPKVEAKIIDSGTTAMAEGNQHTFAIPAIGLSVPIKKSGMPLRFGIAAYGSSGAGVDYRDTLLDQPTAILGVNPLITGEYTALQIMKFAPTLAAQVGDNISIGGSLHINYASLDLRNGSSPGYGYGIQLGTLFQPIESVSLGLTYVSPQTVKHEKVVDFDQNGFEDNLRLQAPQQLGAGMAYAFDGDLQALLELNLKWYNWSDAKGYDDFDWDDQLITALGVQIKPTDRISLRAGYNYGASPLKEHNGFNGTLNLGPPPSPVVPVVVQGKVLPTYYYETFRIIGFPAITEHHITLGFGYNFGDTFHLNLGYMYGLENTVRQYGLNLFGQPTVMESTLSMQGLDFGLTWIF